MQLRAPGKSIVIRPVRPNLGVQEAYRKQLLVMVEAMNASIIWWVSAAYRGDLPAMAMAMDAATPATVLRRVMVKLARRWQRQFDEAAEKMATTFADGATKAAEANAKSILAKAGFSVPFVQTPDMRDAFSSVVGENIALIKSMPAQAMTDVQGAVMRSVQAGRDLGTLRDELISLGAKSENRAALIARDQNNKATAVMSKARRLSLGLTKAKWRHSKGGVHPRKSHQAADSKVYDIAVGCYIDGEYIMPGEKINCRCVSAVIIPGFDSED